MIKQIIIVFCLYSVFAEVVFAKDGKLLFTTSGVETLLPINNSASDIVVQNDSVWCGTGNGLMLTINKGNSWISFKNTPSFSDKGISAICVKNDTCWVASGFTVNINDSEIQAGYGLNYSVNKGTTWNFINQPIDENKIDSIVYGINKIRAFPVTVKEENITFDIALTSGTVWIASKAGMLRKSNNIGVTWHRVILPPDNLNSISPNDTLIFDLSPTRNLNHIVFSIYASNDSTIWVGTAGGINKSTDGGISWIKYTHQNNGLSGNFVVALKEQVCGVKKIIWASTLVAVVNTERRGVSYSEDDGVTWKTTLLGEFAHNFAVSDSGNIVYVATDNGLFRSADYGTTWTKSGEIFDQTTLQRFVAKECYAVAVQGDTVWYGGTEGVAYTIDSPSSPFGSVWKIFRTYDKINSEKRTYAYPNPFAPDDEPIRLHYSLVGENSSVSSVTIKIYDYSMRLVKTLISGATRSNGKEYDEIWNGKNENNSYVANGVYFYTVEINNQKPIFGKILVVK